MFIEENSDYQGIRLFLKKIKKDNDHDITTAMTKRQLTPVEDKEKGPKNLDIFKMERILLLIGSWPYS